MSKEAKERILAGVVDAIREIAHLPDLEITGETRLAEELALDSLDLVEVSMLLEESFDVEFPQEAVRRLRRVADIVDYLGRHIVEQPPAQPTAQPCSGGNVFHLRFGRAAATSD